MSGLVTVLLHKQGLLPKTIRSERPHEPTAPICRNETQTLGLSFMETYDLFAFNWIVESHVDKYVYNVLCMWIQ